MIAKIRKIVLLQVFSTSCEHRLLRIDPAIEESGEHAESFSGWNVMLPTIESSLFFLVT